jgi:hypothetical protein
MGSDMIIYSNPFRSDKNIGKAYNDFIRCLNVPEDTWIVLQDGDITYLTDDWGKRIEDSLALDGNKFGLVGCRTNRIKQHYQLHEGNFSFDTDIKNHYQIALTYNEVGIEPMGRGEVIAGYFMAFKKSTWQAVGGFMEKNIACDAIFSEQVKATGLKLGQLKNLYVFHCYRIWNDTEPWKDKKHLL